VEEPPQLKPIVQKDRIDILDGLRGFAILGIFIINARIFSGYAFISAEEKQDMLWAEADHIFNWIHIVFFSAKFYTLFSLLFGIGFAILLVRAMQNNRPFLSFFSRRLFILFIIGLIHLWAIWYSDILVFYALCGFLMIAFRKFSNTGLLIASMVLLILTALHAWYIHTSGGGYTEAIYKELSQKWQEAQLPRAPSEYDTFRMPDIAEVIRDKSWSTVARFNAIGPWLRIYLISYDARILRILAIFLLGFWTGRQILQHQIHENKIFLTRTALISWAVGLPINIFFVEGDASLGENSLRVPLENIITSIGYIALALAYASSFALLYLSRWRKALASTFSGVGKTALTNYILQSILGILIFYSAALGWGEFSGSTIITLVVLVVFILQVLASNYWMGKFRFGPLEWIWRTLTYGKFISIKKENKEK
jgi:uncharacterized protein